MLISIFSCFTFLYCPLSLSLPSFLSFSLSLFPGVPDQVTNVSGSLISFFDIYISWSVPSSNFGLNQHYNVEYRLLVDSVNPSNVSALASSYKLTDVAPNSNYTVIVSSVNDVGRGPQSNSFTIPSISSGVSYNLPLFHHTIIPSYPDFGCHASFCTNVIIIIVSFMYVCIYFIHLDMASLLRVRIPSIFITSTEILILWGLPPLFRPIGQRPAIIERYLIAYIATNGGRDTSFNLRNNSLNLTIDSLTPSTEYSINVNVVYSSPNGLKGNPVYVIIKTKPAGKIQYIQCAYMYMYMYMYCKIIMLYSNARKYMQNYFIKISS